MSVFKKRERFDRSDVPVPSARRNVAGVVVILVVFAALFCLVDFVRNRVDLESHLGDSELADAVDATANTSAPSGYADSTDEFTRVLVLTASSLDDGATLTQAQVLVVNATQNLGYTVSFPLDAQVYYDSTKLSLSDCYAQYGAVGAVSGLAAGSCLGFNSVIVTTGLTTDELAALAGSNSAELLSTHKDLVEKTESSMAANDLVSFADLLAGVGVANLTPVEAPVFSEATVVDEQGTAVAAGYFPMDSYTLMVTLGIWYYA